MPAGGEEALISVPCAVDDDDGDAMLSLNTSIGFTLRFLDGVWSA